MSLKLVSSNKGWHSQWFYLKNSTATPFLAYSSHGIFKALEEWKWGISTNDLSKIDNHLAAIKVLKTHGLKGARVIGEYHVMEVAPLMRHTLPLHMMVPRASPEGTVLGKRAPSGDEIIRRIRGAMELMKDTVGDVIDVIYLVPNHPPPMHPEPGFI
jgi:hypothetical protein